MYLLEFNIMSAVQIAVMFVFFIAIAWLLAEFKGMKDEMKERLGINNETIRLKLQAYERLSVFADRAGLKNLISRMNSFGESSASMHASLIETLKSEYDYNVSQQVYISGELWKAITKLKDQNIYVINQLAATLPHHANGMDLCKRILEYSMNENAELNQIVLDAIKYEARKLLK
jgi:hypothetical protein